MKNSLYFLDEAVVEVPIEVWPMPEGLVYIGQGPVHESIRGVDGLWHVYGEIWKEGGRGDGLMPYGAKIGTNAHWAYLAWLNRNKA